MEQSLFYLMVILSVGHICAQRISDIKCYEYSRTPINLKNPLPHMAVWVEGRIINFQFSNVNNNIVNIWQMRPSILISQNFLISHNPWDSWESDAPVNRSRIYFSYDDWHDVVQKIEHSSNDYTLYLLKISRIEVDSNHRPACLWARNDKFTLMNLPASGFVSDRVEVPFTFNDYYPDDLPKQLKKTLKITMLQFNISFLDDSCTFSTSLQINDDLNLCIKPNFDSYQTNMNIRQKFQLNKFPHLTLIQRPFTYLPSNYYLYGLGNFPSFMDTVPTIIKPISGETIEWIESNVWKTTTDPSCGIVEPRFGQPMLLHSMPTQPEEFPWHTTLYHVMRLGNREYQCGGTLLNEITVITAAHCVTTRMGTMSPFNLLVVLGKDNLVTNSLDTRESRITNVTVHSEYNKNIFANDIAILKLTTIMRYSKLIQPICLTTNDRMFDNKIGILPGWGLNELGEQPLDLQKASFPIRAQNECRITETDFTGLVNFVNENNFCAGYANGTSLCKGDSGGGLVFQHDNQWFLKGIASVGVALPGSGECDPLGLSLFTDVVKFNDWIMDNM